MYIQNSFQSQNVYLKKINKDPKFLYFLKKMGENGIINIHMNIMNQH